MKKYKINKKIHIQGAKNMRKKVKKYPISVSVDATEWHLYKSGEFSGCKHTEGTNHAVLLVGYRNKDYWIVRNSWGEDWGEEGFIRLKFEPNVCNIENRVY